MTTTASESTAVAAQDELRGRLVAAGLLLETGVPGLLGQGEVFVRVREGIDDLITRTGRDETPTRLIFPAIVPRRLLEDVGYVGSFPQLTMTLWSFEGGERDALKQAEVAAAHGDWSEFQTMTDLAMKPAACEPMYPAIAAMGPQPVAGRTWDTGPAEVFRREPSGDPARMQAFHMRELVRVGTPEDVAAWRDSWRDRWTAVLGELGVDVRVEEANDPFFGRVGRMMAASQRAQALKFEALGLIAGPELNAISSFNAHQDHFSATFGITLEDGTQAHTGCLGLGLDRMTLTLFVRHGLDPDTWPQDVRDLLWP